MSDNLPASVVPNLIAQYHCNEASGTLLDNSPNAYHMTAVNAPDSAAGVFGTTARRMVRSSVQYFILSDNTAFRPSAFQICGWAFYNSAGVNSFIASFGNPSPELCWTLQINGSGSAIRMIMWDGTSLIASAQGSVISTTTWTFFNAGWDIATDKVWCGLGSEQVEGAFSESVTASAGPFRIGRSPTSDSTIWDGRLDEISCFNRRITGAELASIQKYSKYNRSHTQLAMGLGLGF